MGQAWKLGLWRVFRPLFDLVDQNKLVHSLAARYIYSKELYADFFVLASGLGLSSLAALLCRSTSRSSRCLGPR